MDLTWHCTVRSSLFSSSRQVNTAHKQTTKCRLMTSKEKARQFPMVDHWRLTGKGRNGPPGGLSKWYTKKGIQDRKEREGGTCACLTRDSLPTFSAIDLRMYHLGMLTMDGAERTDGSSLESSLRFPVSGSRVWNDPVNTGSKMKKRNIFLLP